MYKIDKIDIDPLTEGLSFKNKEHTHFRTISVPGLIKVLNWYEDSTLFGLKSIGFTILINGELPKLKYIKAYFICDGLDIPNEINIEKLQFLGNYNSKSIWLEEICEE